MSDADPLRDIAEAIAATGAPPCAMCDFARTDCRGKRACEAFASWTQTGEAAGNRTPTLEHFALLFPGDVTASLLHRHWRKHAGRLSGATQRGEIAPMTKAEGLRRYRERLKLIWLVDPMRREAHLARKRADAMRRERARGRLPLTPERATARVKLAWARRRAQAGPPMSREELRGEMARRDLSVEDLARALGLKPITVEIWLRPTSRGIPAHAAAWLRSRRTPPGPARARRERSDAMDPAELRESLAVCKLTIPELAAQVGVNEGWVKLWFYPSTRGPPKRVAAWLRTRAAIVLEASPTPVVGLADRSDRCRPQDQPSSPRACRDPENDRTGSPGSGDRPGGRYVGTPEFQPAR